MANNYDLTLSTALGLADLCSTYYTGIAFALGLSYLLGSHTIFT